MSNIRKSLYNESKKLIELAEKSKKNGKFTPQQIQLKTLQKSPAYKTPEKWISKLRFISDEEKITSYKPLDNSPIAEMLASPGRMTHSTRTVIPRDFLIPLRVMNNPQPKDTKTENMTEEQTTKTNKKQCKSKKKIQNDFKYIIAPIHPEDPKLPEDPVTYYPNVRHIFEEYSKEKNNETTQLNKFSVALNMYPFIRNPKEVGWNPNTVNVIESIYIDLLAKLIKTRSTDFVQSDTIIRLANNLDPNKIDSAEKNITAISISNILERNPNILSELDIEMPFDIPVTKANMELAKMVLRYNMYLQE